MFFKRKLKLGILFSHNENWIGGSYYLLNLINSFNQLDEQYRPEIIIISDKESDYEVARQTKYPYLRFINYNFEEPYNLYQRLLFRFFPKYCKKNFRTYFTKKHVDVIFPYTSREKFKNDIKKVYWYPDFQEYHYPDFFSEPEIQARKKLQQEFVTQPVTLVLSSNSALNDFKNIYSGYKCKPCVVNFAVTHPDYEDLNIDALKQKYKINSDYFISPNQFWKHKNHFIILKAVKFLKDKGKNIKVVFTGKEYDYRNPTYTDDLKLFVKENNIEENVLFLGFIDRSEQLKLMKHAKAIIQPSLFEGWSTVVEDAKAMNQFVIASDISVHKEQLKENVIFFEKENYRQLAGILDEYKSDDRPVFENYNSNIKQFAVDFLKAIGK